MSRLLLFLITSVFSINALSDNSFISKINQALDINIESMGINKTISSFLESKPGKDEDMLAPDCYYGSRMLSFAIQEQAVLIDKDYFNQAYHLVRSELELSNFLLTKCKTKLSEEQITAIEQLSLIYTNYINQYNKISNKAIKGLNIDNNN